jgi:acyl carrier protein
MSSTDRNELLQTITTRLHGLREDIDRVGEDTDLVADLGLDSVQVLEMCTDLEDELDISIPVNRLGEVRTAGQLADVLVQLLEEDN